MGSVQIEVIRHISQGEDFTSCRYDTSFRLTLHSYGEAGAAEAHPYSPISAGLHVCALGTSVKIPSVVARATDGSCA